MICSKAQPESLGPSYGNVNHESANGRTPSFSSPRKVLKWNLKARPGLASPLPSRAVCPTRDYESRIPSLRERRIYASRSSWKRNMRIIGTSHSTLTFSLTLYYTIISNASPSLCSNSTLTPLITHHPSASVIQTRSALLQGNKDYTSMKDTQ